MEVLIHRGISWKDLETHESRLVDQVTNSPEKAFLLISEPQSTFTFGPSSNPADLLWKDPAEAGVAVHSVQRGGKWTYHGPGQIVVYPIASLSQLGYPKRGVRRYLEDLAQGIQSFLHSHSISATLGSCPFGVYTPLGKIASFGVRVSAGITSHGVAFYLKPQTPYFQGIVPCGQSQTRITSLQECGIDMDWIDAARELSGYIERSFQVSKN